MSEIKTATIDPDQHRDDLRMLSSLSPRTNNRFIDYREESEKLDDLKGEPDE